MSGWWLYLCDKKGRFYAGITTNIEKRLKQHGSPELLYKEGSWPLRKKGRRQQRKTD